MPRMILLKTHPSSIPGVVRHAKHASHVPPMNISNGDILLIAQNVTKLRPGEKQIRYVMEFVRSYCDLDNESDMIWGRHWPYIIEGTNIYELKHPFSIGAVQVTQTNYGRGVIRFAYVHSADAQTIMDRGLLSPLIC